MQLQRSGGIRRILFCALPLHKATLAATDSSLLVNQASDCILRIV